MNRTLALFILLSIVPSVSSAGEPEWRLSMMTGRANVLTVPFISTDERYRDSIGWAIDLGHSMEGHQTDYGKGDLSAYGRYARFLNTGVVSVGGRYAFFPDALPELGLGVKLGLGRVFGDWSGDLIIGERRYLAQKANGLVYDTGLAIFYEFTRSQSIGIELTHLSTCAGCGLLKLPHAKRNRNPGVNVIGIFYRKSF